MNDLVSFRLVAFHDDGVRLRARHLGGRETNNEAVLLTDILLHSRAVVALNPGVYVAWSLPVVCLAYCCGASYGENGGKGKGTRERTRDALAITTFLVAFSLVYS
jgi:hypothetical protein